MASVIHYLVRCKYLVVPGQWVPWLEHVALCLIALADYAKWLALYIHTNEWWVKQINAHSMCYPVPYSNPG